MRRTDLRSQYSFRRAVRAYPFASTPTVHRAFLGLDNAPPPAAMMQTPQAHRKAPGPIADAAVARPVRHPAVPQALRAITTAYDEMPGPRLAAAPAAGDTGRRAAGSARKFVYVQNPSPRNQTFIVQKAAGSSRRTTARAAR